MKRFEIESADPARQGKRIDQIANLKRRLAQTGYPAELRIGRTLANNGWNVEHASYYRESTTQIWREIDILARVQVGVERHQGDESEAVGGLSAIREHDDTLIVTYVIECKQSTHEWVLFLPTQELPPGASFNSYPWFDERGIGRDLVDALDACAHHAEGVGEIGEVDDLLGELPFTPMNMVGHGIAAVADGEKAQQGKNRAYSAVESCIAAVGFYEENLLRRFSELSAETARNHPLVLYLPVVVLDGDLFVCSVAADGTEILRQVSSGAVHIRPPTGAAGLTVPVVTVEALADFARHANDSWRRIGEFVLSNPNPYDDQTVGNYLLEIFHQRALKLRSKPG